MPGTTENSTNGSPNSSTESESNSGASTQPSNSDDPLFQEPIQPKTWQEKAVNRQILIRQAHEGMMLGKIMRQNKIIEDQVRSSVGELNDGEGGDMDDDMGLNIGNETHYHYQTSQPQSPSQPSTNSGEPSTLSRIAYAALAAAAIGGPAVTWWAMSGEDNATIPQPPAAVGADTDTLTDVVPGFGVPQNVE